LESPFLLFAATAKAIEILNPILKFQSQKTGGIDLRGSKGPDG
jgi:hypothetical protein